MGEFAKVASQHDASRRSDSCVAGRWIEDNMDQNDVTELIRLANSHKWELICRLSGNRLKVRSLKNHVHGGCACSSDHVARGCVVDTNNTEM